MNSQLVAVDQYDAVQTTGWLNLLLTLRDLPGCHGAMAWLEGKAVGLILLMQKYLPESV